MNLKNGRGSYMGFYRHEVRESSPGSAPVALLHICRVPLCPDIGVTSRLVTGEVAE